MLTNAGQANAATGDQGYADSVECAKLLAQSLGVTPDDVLLQSTGARRGAGRRPGCSRGLGAAGKKKQQQEEQEERLHPASGAAPASLLEGPPWRG